jgi:hypothetical protein
MDKLEVIEQFCELQRKAHQHIGFDTAADCFCQHSNDNQLYDYQNQGKALEFIRLAVAEKITRDKHTKWSVHTIL